jgi:DNA-binding transcriptional LysR family regulator
VPEHIQEVNELQTALGLVAAGIGLAIVPESVQGLFGKDVKYVSLSDASCTSPIMLSWRKNDQSDFLKSALALARAAPVPE